MIFRCVNWPCWVVLSVIEFGKTPANSGSSCSSQAHAVHVQADDLSHMQGTCFYWGTGSNPFLLMKSPPCLLMSILNQYVISTAAAKWFHLQNSLVVAICGLEVLQAAYENRWCNLEHIGRNLKISRVWEIIEL